MMEEPSRNLPLSMVSLVFGALSIPLAFAVHLVSLALVLGVLAMAFGAWGRKHSGKGAAFTLKSTKRAQRGLLLGAIGTGCALLMWVLWTTNTLL